jgi:hypothetical protein
MMLLSIPLFLILGFRYRILLTFFGLFLIYIYDRGLTFKSILKYISILLLALYAMLLLTENRNAIYMQKFDQLTFNMSEFDYDIIFDQARGSVMDFAVYQYMDNSSNVSIDYGETMFGYIIVKLMPSVFFEGGVKPYPPPTFLIIDEAIGATRDNGEAVTSLGGTFLSFYYPGIYVSGFLLGFIIAKLQNRFDNNDFSMLGAIIANLVLFQWISRGYLPQVIDHLAYMLFPLLMIRYFSNYKIRVDANPTVK